LFVEQQFDLPSTRLATTTLAVATRDGIDAVQQSPGLFGIESRRLAGLYHMLWAADGMRQIGGDNLASDQPVEQHWQAGAA
jgi:hypothetical protein